MKHYLLILLTLTSSSLIKAQSTDDVVQKKIQQLKSNGIDSIVCYYVNCIGEVMTNDSCDAATTKYLIWSNKHQSYIQKFKNCGIYESQTLHASFMSLLTHNLIQVREEQIKPPEYNKIVNGKKVLAIGSVDHSCHTVFEIYIRQSIVVKDIDEFNLATKYVEGNHRNKNYYKNRQTVLYKLKQLIEKETSGMSL